MKVNKNRGPTKLNYVSTDNDGWKGEGKRDGDLSCSGL